MLHAKQKSSIKGTTAIIKSTSISDAITNFRTLLRRRLHSVVLLGIIVDRHGDRRESQRMRVSVIRSRCPLILSYAISSHSLCERTGARRLRTLVTCCCGCSFIAINSPIRIICFGMQSNVHANKFYANMCLAQFLNKRSFNVMPQRRHIIHYLKLTIHQSVFHSILVICELLITLKVNRFTHE